MGKSLQKQSHISSDKKIPFTMGRPISLSEENRESLLWWMQCYFHEFAAGTERTLRAKTDDLKLFYSWFVQFKGHDRLTEWSRATTDFFIRSMQTAKIQQQDIEERQLFARNKKAQDHRWSARSINRKIDNLKHFSKWLRGQVPSPLHSDPFHQIKRMDVPILEAKRIEESDLEALTTAALHLSGTEVRKDRSRFQPGKAPLKKQARPLRDYAIFALFKGTGLRENAVCQLNQDQLKPRRLVKVKEKGRQERQVVMSQEAYDAVKLYLSEERVQDAKVWERVTSLFLPVHQTKARQANLKNAKEDYEPRLTPGAISKIVKKIAKKGLGKEGEKRIHPHLFRHHMGFVMNEQGGITAVQKQLGHANLTYSAVYAQKTEEELESYLDEAGV